MKRILYIVFIVSVMASCGRKDDYTAYAAATIADVAVFESPKKGEIVPSEPIARGSALIITPDKAIRQDGVKYLPAKIGKRKFYIAEEAVAASPEECVREKELFVQTAASLIDDTLSSHICDFAKKGRRLEVVGFDKLLPDGSVRRYKVKRGESSAWIFGKYTVLTQEEAAERYSKFDEAHKAVKNSFKGGEAVGCEFRPYEKPVFLDNPMPNPVNAFYLTISPAGLKNIDSFIALADSTNINAFVIDIKDNECPGYKAEAMEKYSPTNYKWAGSNKEALYKEAIDKLHAKGYYQLYQNITEYIFEIQMIPLNVLIKILFY